MAIAIFIIFELKDVIDNFVGGKVKIAEANARAEEAKLERKKLETRA
ncbi:hypothetical protein H7Y29_03135 [Microbacteriaceae bacterium]|nr:hypothetical protein [Candidatus Saccharibacteria bacterium]